MKKILKYAFIITVFNAFTLNLIWAQSSEDIASYLKNGGAGGVSILNQLDLAKKTNQLGTSPQANTNATIVTNTPADSFNVNPNKNAPNVSADNNKTTAELAPQVVKSANAVFGQDFFDNNQIKLFEKVPNGKAPDNYVLDAGDELNISIWGNSELNEVFRVDEDGYIQPNVVGRIFLKGLTFKEAQSVILKRFGNSYDLNSSKIAIRLNYSRSINVHIVGEVKNPGTYNISAINSAFNALSAANGPDSIGSVRNIYIKRNGKIIKQIDLYDFLINPSSNTDYYLMDNDYIVVPSLGKVVTVKGEVKRPGKYELKPADEINELINFCGGTKPNAYLSAVQIVRYKDNKLQFEEVNVTNNSTVTPLKDGDIVSIRGINSQISNFAVIKGAVNVPDKYEINEHTQISDLIQKAGGLINRSYTTTGYLLRYQDDLTRTYFRFNVDSVVRFPSYHANFTLTPYDEIIIFNKEKFFDSITVAISGNVRNPGVFDYGDKMRLKDLIYFAGGLDLNAANNRIEIARINKEGNRPMVKAIIKTVTINKDLSLDNESENFILEPFDEVFVRKLPGANKQQFVKIEGEVKYPGTYAIANNNEKIIDLVARAGGLTPYAFTLGAKLNRKADNAGNVILDLRQAVNKPKSEFNYVLQDGDSINIPKMNEIISVFGAVTYSGMDSLGRINTPYVKNKNAKYYINNYIGGFDKNAKRNKIVVVEANGRIKKTKNFILFNITPKVQAGGKIYVPFKEKNNNEVVKTPTDWNRVIEGFTIKATGIITLALIMKNLLKK